MNLIRNKYILIWIVVHYTREMDRSFVFINNDQPSDFISAHGTLNVGTIFVNFFGVSFIP